MILLYYMNPLVEELRGKDTQLITKLSILPMPSTLVSHTLVSPIRKLEIDQNHSRTQLGDGAYSLTNILQS